MRHGARSAGQGRSRLLSSRPHRNRRMRTQCVQQHQNRLCDWALIAPYIELSDQTEGVGDFLRGGVEPSAVDRMQRMQSSDLQLAFCAKVLAIGEKGVIAEREHRSAQGGISASDQSRRTLELRAGCEATKGTSHVALPRGHTTLETLAPLKPALRPNGTITAGNASAAPASVRPKTRGRSVMRGGNALASMSVAWAP